MPLRTDDLGHLARTFQRMAREVQAREERLQSAVQELPIEIDQGSKAREVAQITETNYFHNLREKAREMKKRTSSGDD